ncbi:orotidine-5'-phosphate decarboxylase [Edaphobacter albus]|uniref:orotidine-5'-phosphate decarboxylase n=1 Tax=Edaphobacter sp. 4G125 TaxID=2763071 RepID=UPI00164720E7|nr:orotidine-5'-phosphate decarboxylase [Edaphobacter sp. 4G125]QNI35470.1 orotidine-5'-phosphate decarboxylase [Edaphobacter sp. 4G125]
MKTPTNNAFFSADPRDRFAVALDVPDAKAALGLVDRLEDSCRWLKVGMELYYAAGNSLVESLQKRDFRIFLDLKLHDIPNTVAGAVRSVAGLGAELLTVHGGGGGAMLRAAAEAAEQLPQAPRLIAVTVLTSMDRGELTSVGVSASPAEQALRLAHLAKNCGIDGMVCSPEEAASLRSEIGPEAILVVPGIRPAGSAVDDQRRVASPGEAISRGASLLVVGRPITRAEDPAKAARAIVDEIAAARTV